MGDRLLDLGGLADGDRVADVVAAAGGQYLGRPEPRVGPQGQLAADAGTTHPPGQLLHEPFGTAGGVGPPGAHAGMQYLAGVGSGGQQRMVAEHPGVAVGRALLGMPVDLTHGRVHIHRQRPSTRSGTGRPGPGEDLFGQPVQLTDMPEGEPAQERPQG